MKRGNVVLLTALALSIGTLLLALDGWHRAAAAAEAAAAVDGPSAPTGMP